MGEPWLGWAFIETHFSFWINFVGSTQRISIEKKSTKVGRGVKRFRFAWGRFCVRNRPWSTKFGLCLHIFVKNYQTYMSSKIYFYKVKICRVLWAQPLDFSSVFLFEITKQIFIQTRKLKLSKVKRFGFARARFCVRNRPQSKKLLPFFHCFRHIHLNLISL